MPIKGTILKQPLLHKIKIANFSTETVAPIKMSFRAYEGKATDEATQQNEPPPLIMMHGLLGSSALWRSHCKGFHEYTLPKRRVFAVDARNHGDSPRAEEHSYPHLAEDLRTFVNARKLNKAALLGHSMGGRAVMYFALQNPELVEKLIVADISPVSESPTFKDMTKLLEGMQKINLPRQMPKLAAKLNVDEQLVACFKDPDICTFILTNLVENIDGSYSWKANLPALVENFDNILTFPNVNRLKYFGPTLFVLGGESDFVPDSDHERIQELFPNVQFHKLRGVGHWMHTQKPYEFNKVCVKFLNRKH